MFKDYKQRLGSTRYKDCLSHTYSYDFEGTGGKPNEYVPGETQ
jgi:hypothetical protein